MRRCDESTLVLLYHDTFVPVDGNKPNVVFGAEGMIAGQSESIQL